MSWRSLLPDDGGARRAPLALGVDLRQRTSRAEAHWGPRRLDSVTPRALARRQDDLVLTARPLVRGAGGGWVKGDVSWDTVRRTPERYVAAHARWFAELHSIAHDVRATGPFASVSEWLVLDGVTSTLLWRHLADAADARIPIVSVSRQQQVSLAPAADVEIEVARAGSGLRVGARVTLDGTPVDAALVRPIGHAGLYAFEIERDPIPLTLAPFSASAPVAAVLAAPAGIRVPAEERDAFLREALPHLARRARVLAGPGVVVPDPRRPALRLRADFESGGSVTYRFAWTYAGLPPIALDAAPDDDRDTRAEDDLRARAERAWADASELPFLPAASLRDDDAFAFAIDVLPALEASGAVRVETTGERPRAHELAGDPAITVTTVESADPDWFGLGIVVTIDGRRIPFGPLLTALTRGRARLRLADGAYFSLAHPALDRLRELLEEAAALDEWEAGPRLHRTQISLWEDFEDLADEAEPALAWRRTVRAFTNDPAVADAAPPAGVRAELRPYQRAGFSWLRLLWDAGLGGILADDMGLGKTLQTLAFLASAAPEVDRPFLVVAPTSVVPSWLEQAARFVPDLDVRVLEATSVRSGRSVAERVRGAAVVVTSYSLLRLDDAEYAGMTWAGVVLDEAQFVKNPATRLHRAVAALPARTVIALTGTPLENGLSELWALLALTAPGLFPSARRFREEYVRPIEEGKVPDNVEGGPYRARRVERLRRRIRPLVLRRTKDAVAPELPPKQEQDLTVDLSPAHRELYDVVLHRERQKVLGLLDDLDRQRFIVFRSLTLLRLLSLAPALVDPAHAEMGSAKLDALVDRLAELAAEGHRALVFSQFTSFLDLAGARLDAAGLPFARLDGSTPRRGEVIDAFRRGDDPVFLVSLKAGGFGMTVTEADYVFLLDPWWNPAAEAQAIDRTHRIGQEQSVFVYRLLAADTIEQKVRELQGRKARLFSAVLDDDDLFAQTLTADDIRALLEP